MLLIIKVTDLVVLLRSGELYLVQLNETGIEQQLISDTRYVVIQKAYNETQYYPYPAFHALRADGVMDTYLSQKEDLPALSDQHDQQAYPNPPAIQLHDPRMFVIEYRFPYPESKFIRTIEYQT